MSAALKLLEEQAMAGDGKACLDLYEEYRHGLHVLPDQQTANTWLEKALDFNNADAQLIMGMKSLKNGNTQEGIGYIELSAENNNPDAMNLLGQMYLGNVDGVDVAEDRDKGLALVIRAGLQGSLQAQILLGKCYYTGKWVDKCQALACYWLEKAADSGDPKAQELLDEVLLVKNVIN